MVSSQKDQQVNMYKNMALAMDKLTQETINQLPVSKQTIAKEKYKTLSNTQF